MVLLNVSPHSNLNTLINLLAPAVYSFSYSKNFLLIWSVQYMSAWLCRAAGPVRYFRLILGRTLHLFHLSNWGFSVLQSCYSISIQANSCGSCTLTERAPATFTIDQKWSNEDMGRTHMLIFSNLIHFDLPSAHVTVRDCSSFSQEFMPLPFTPY